MTEKPSSVPYSYRARLVHSFRPNPEIVVRTDEKATITGHVHPDPYTHSEAVTCAQDRLRMFTNNGWQIVDLRVLAYGEQS